MIQSFPITDGQLPLIGGVRNLNVPGDDDGATNGQIHADLFYPGDFVLDHIAGTYIYRVSDSGTDAQLAAGTFTVRQNPQPQGVTGRITAAATGLPLANIIVVLAVQNGPGVTGTFTDSNGNYTIYSTPDAYEVGAFKNGFVADFASVTVGANQLVTKNLALASASLTVSGTVTDSASGAGIEGIIVSAESPDGNGPAAIGFTDRSGNYSLQVTAGQWQIRPSEGGDPPQGYLGLRNGTDVNVTGNVSNVDFQLPKATALIYGNLEDDQHNALTGIQMQAEDQSGQFRAQGRVFATTGDYHYSLAVVAGSWNVGPAGDDPGLRGYFAQGATVSLSAGQSLRRDFTAQRSTAHLRGRLVDTSAAAVSGIGVNACPQEGGQCPSASTGADGSFDIAVVGGMWNLNFSNGDLEQIGLIGPQFSLTVVDGVDQNNIVAIALPVTAQITGTVRDCNGNPISELDLYAFATINGTQYNVNGTTDSGGNYSLGVSAGTWQVGLSCGGSNGLPTHGLPCVENQSVTVPGQNPTVDFSVRCFSAHLVGRLVDAMSNGVGNIDVSACPQGGGQCPSMSTSADGSFSVGVFGGTWNLSFFDLESRGLIGPQLSFTVVDGVDQTGIMAVALPVTAQITGTVHDGNGNPISDLQVYAFATISGINYNVGNSRTDGSGNYSLSVANGNWQVGLNCSNDSHGLGSRGLPCVSNQSVSISGQDQMVNFCAGCGPHLRGTVFDDMGTPVASIHIFAFPQSGGFSPQTMTDGNGNFDLAVSDNGTWTLELSATEAAQRCLVSPSVMENVTNGNDVNGILFVAKKCTAQITGSVKDGNGSPVASVGLFASATINGVNYLANASTDDSGNYRLVVIDGQWRVDVDCGGPSGLSSRGYNCPPTQFVTINNNNPVVNFVVQGMLRVITPSLPDGTKGVPYMAQLQASGGQQPYTWSLGSDTPFLPPTLNLAADGSISGTPVINGTFNVHVRVTDSPHQTADATFPLVIRASMPTPTSGVCVGDCNGDHVVSVDEILLQVNIALGNAEVSPCMPGDANHDNMITIAEILTAVNNALSGCAGH